MDLRKAHYGVGTENALALYRTVVAFYDNDDRVLTDDIKQTHDFLRSGGLLGLKNS